MDSDDDFFYSSPEDEDGEFMSREFLKDYDSARSDRLVAMGKGELINEYLQMEARIDALEKRLQRSSRRRDASANSSQPIDPDTTERISVFQREIHALEAENAALREETRVLREERQSEAEAVVVTEEAAKGRIVDDDAEAIVSSSSSDEEASSSDSGSGSDGESDEEEDGNVGIAAAVHLEAQVEPRLEKEDNNHGDTGYESQPEGPDVTSSST